MARERVEAFERGKEVIDHYITSGYGDGDKTIYSDILSDLLHVLNEGLPRVKPELRETADRIFARAWSNFEMECDGGEEEL